ncbi:CCA tRNA nucleotidyltransferase [Candidatus Roizmanbacteria bacterium]|nr:CCA tRNA nucleotidyltransferase [Candidatus Roizmanbacteria bacterium]
MFTLPKEVNDFLITFTKKKYPIYVVGGAVRNLLLQKPVTNWDFATAATPEEILQLYPDGFYNNQFGTVGLEKEVAGVKLIFEVTTFRKEGQYRDRRHPDKIEWAKTIEDDLARRDFTINAMAYDGQRLIDPYDGQRHLREKRIVAVGDPDKRFTEDALRLIRAVRFAAQLEFLLDEPTRLSIQRNAPLIANISAERIRDEFFKILVSPHPDEGVLFLKNTGLLACLLPEVDICFMIPQKSPKRHHIYDVGTHLAMSLKHCPSADVITRFATLLHDIGKATTFRRDKTTGLITFYNHEVAGTRLVQAIAERFRLSNLEKKKLVTLVKYHQFTVNEGQTDKTLRRFIRQVGTEYLNDILALRTGDRIGSGARPTSWRFDLFKKRLVEVQKSPFRVTDVKITGYDVMKVVNIKPGPKIGKILSKIFNDVEEGRLKNERAPLLSYLRDLGKS